MLGVLKYHRGELRQMRQRYGAIFHKRDRLGLFLHRHHDVEAGFAQFGNGVLQGGIVNLDHPAPFGAAMRRPDERDAKDQRRGPIEALL